jgi:hypothetical protein
MLRNLVIIGDPYTRRPPVLPQRPPSELWHCHSTDEVVAAATCHGVTAVVLVGPLATHDAVARLRATAGHLPLVAVTSAACPADILVSPRDGARGYLAAVVRYLAGEPVRTSPRICAGGTVRLEGGEALALVDIAEGGVRVAWADDRDLGDQALAIDAEGGLELCVRAREIRRHGGSHAVFAFTALGASDRLRLRAWLTRAGGSRPCA